MNLSPKTLNASGRIPASHSRTISINCPGLPEFDGRDLDAVRIAFSNSPVCVFRQAWLENEQTDFAPGLIRIGWRGDSLLIFAELTDTDIRTWDAGPNHHFWKLGELLEIFLRPAGQEGYSEFHVTPNNQQLHLRYENAEHVENLRKSGAFAEALVKEPSFNSQTWVKSGDDRWFVFAELPVSAVSEKIQSLAGSQWHFSFSRYDYTHGRNEPVISSTSGHQEPDFHRQHEWGVMTFTASTVISPARRVPVPAVESFGK